MEPEMLYYGKRDCGGPEQVITRDAQEERTKDACPAVSDNAQTFKPQFILQARWPAAVNRTRR